MIEALITRLFKTRNAAHMEHWQTTSNSKHEALGKFYEELIPLLDKFVESRQGILGVVGDTPDKVKDSMEALREDLIWMATNRDKVTDNIPALENILDEINALYMQTLFKLERLK
jgi:hypothetical protein